VDLLVVGLDLTTGHEVHVTDRSVADWVRQGHNGDRTLVCAQCYAGADQPGGPRVIGLVPRGRLGGVRRPHFAHPPGMAPLGGRHGRETLWHAETKQRLRRWAVNRGASARVEAYIPGGRRRSDVSVTLPGGPQVAIEVQLGEISDAEWLARHRDYAQAGIVDVWLWNIATWVPRVILAEQQPGWIFDLAHDRLGLMYARAAEVAAIPPGSSECRQVHWPPCPTDPLDQLWMPLESALLTPDGIRPSPEAEAEAELAREAQMFARRLSRASEISRSRTSTPLDSSARQPPPRERLLATSSTNPVLEDHQAFLYESRPPWTDPDTWRYRCDKCRRTLTGADLKLSPIVHIVPTMRTSTDLSQPLVSYVRHGGGQSAPSPSRT
jgi:Competence protein CoiA-like family